MELIQNGDKGAAVLKLEMVAISVAINSWKALMSTWRVVVFIHHEAVRARAIRGYFKNHLVDCLMEHLFGVEGGVGCQVWPERVPIHSIPADELSRKVCEELLGSKQRRCVDVMEIWVNAARETGGDSAAKD